MTNIENNYDDGAVPEIKSAPSMKPSQAVSVYRRIGRAAMRINKAADEAWKDWTEVLGPWIFVRVAKAEQLAGGRTRGDLKQKHLQEQFGAEFYPIYQELSDNGTLSQLRKCLRELEAINAYRSRLSERPGSPDGMWRSFENSRRSSPQYHEDTGTKDAHIASDPDSAYNDLENPEDLKPGAEWKRRKTNQMSKDEITEKLNEVLYKLQQRELTGNARDDASNMWARFLEQCANDERLAAAYWREYRAEMDAIVATVLGKDA